MHRLRARGEPEAVFAAIQTRLQDLGAATRLVDAASITLLFDMTFPSGSSSSRFFLAVVPSAETGWSDVAVARRSNDRRRNFKAMIVGEGDPVEEDVLELLVGGPRGT
jgi:hypothetical protein